MCMRDWVWVRGVFRECAYRHGCLGMCTCVSVYMKCVFVCVCIHWYVCMHGVCVHV